MPTTDMTPSEFGRLFITRRDSFIKKDSQILRQGPGYRRGHRIRVLHLVLGQAREH